MKKAEQVVFVIDDDPSMRTAIREPPRPPIRAPSSARWRRGWRPISSESRAIRSKILRLYGGLFSS